MGKEANNNAEAFLMELESGFAGAHLSVTLQRKSLPPHEQVWLSEIAQNRKEKLKRFNDRLQEASGNQETTRIDLSDELVDGQGIIQVTPALIQRFEKISWREGLYTGELQDIGEQQI